jgi:hypothetical protein
LSLFSTSPQNTVAIESETLRMIKSFGKDFKPFQRNLRAHFRKLFLRFGD